MSDGDGEFLTSELCESYRAHLETKIGNMERSIRWSIYLTGGFTAFVLVLVQWYLNVVS